MATPIITITDAAIERIRYLLARRDKPAQGIRVRVKSGGCSGLTYLIEYADKQEQFEEEVKYQDIVVFIDPKAVIYLIGSQMDYVNEKFREGFVFVNPNAKGHCGCGESFFV